MKGASVVSPEDGAKGSQLLNMASQNDSTINTLFITDSLTFSYHHPGLGVTGQFLLAIHLLLYVWQVRGNPCKKNLERACVNTPGRQTDSSPSPG